MNPAISIVNSAPGTEFTKKQVAEELGYKDWGKSKRAIFGLQRPGWAFAEILILLLAILATLAAFWRVKPRAGALLIPYTVWTGFATLLNYTIWRMNA